MVDVQWRYSLFVFSMSFILSWFSFGCVWWLIAITHGDLESELPEGWIPCVVNIQGFWSCFLFSVETQSTIGFGGRATTEECPEAITVMCIQTIFGMMMQAARLNPWANHPPRRIKAILQLIKLSYPNSIHSPSTQLTYSYPKCDHKNHQPSLPLSPQQKGPNLRPKAIALVNTSDVVWESVPQSTCGNRIIAQNKEIRDHHVVWLSPEVGDELYSVNVSVSFSLQVWLFPEVRDELCSISFCWQMLEESDEENGAGQTAFMVGFVFAKMARPKQRTQTLLFSRYATVSLRDGQLCLMFRVGDMRAKSHFIGTSIRAHLVKQHNTREGEYIAPFLTKLEVQADDYDNDLIMIWPMVVVHKIDETSPLYRMSAADLIHERFEIIVVMEGTTESTGQTSQARTSYLPSEVLWGHRFQPLVSYSKERLAYQIDYSLFHRTQQVETPLCSAYDLQMAVDKTIL
ncbi:Inward rectifier potassium channel [Homalodisca vitripennis]|nr:Inward rectifier potassium channel [Homalodisca vitripennis]